MVSKRGVRFFVCIILPILLILCFGAVGVLMFYRKALPDMVGNILTAMAGLSSPSDGHIISLYEQEPPPANVDKNEIRAVIDQFRESIFFITFISSDKATVEMDRFLIPNGYYSEVDVQWNDLFDATGQSVFRPTTAEEKAYQERFQISPWNSIFRTGTDKPVSATGILHIKVPIRFAQIVLKADQIGQPRQADAMAGFSAELLQCDNDVVNVQVTGNFKERQPIIIACDVTGGRLKTSGHAARYSSSFINSTFRASGTVAEVHIFMPLEFITETVDVTASAKPETHGPNAWTVRAPRYAAELTVPDFKEIDAAGVTEFISIVPRRGYAAYGFNMPKIVVYLPRIDNSCYAQVALTELQLFDSSGDMVAHKQRGSWLDFEGMFVRFDITNEEGDHETIVDFERSSGTVAIRYPARLRTVTLAVDAPETDFLEAKFEGPKVMIRGLEDMRHRPFTPERYSLVRGYDAHGRRLKQLDHAPFVPFSLGRDWRMVGFWGTPAKVDIITVGKWLELELPFDIPATEKLPESQRGTKPLHY